MAKFRQPPYSVAEANIISKSITANGTYNASSDNADGYNPVTVNVPESIIVSKSITANGTYNASSDSADGYNPVTVNVPTGVPKMTRAEWDSLTTAEKQALQYVAIQDNSAGFIRGDLAYGADYTPIGQYIPNTPASDIICEAVAGDFVASSHEWGQGSSPIRFDYAPGYGSIQYDSSEDAVYCPVATSGTIPYCDLGAVGNTFTAYIVAKMVNPTAYERILFAMNSRSSGQGMGLLSNPIIVSSWADDTPIGIASTSYFVGVLQYGGPGSGKGGAYGASLVTKSPATCGRFLCIGRTDLSPDTINADPGILYVKYIAVSRSVDSDANIALNLANLANEFLS